MLRNCAAIVLAATVASACARPAAREYELRGQILKVDQARQEVTIEHQDIKGFMPGMTMTFKVAEARLLDGRVPGDLVTATLVVSDRDVHLRTLDRTGSAPVAPGAALPSRMTVLGTGELVADASFVDERGAARRLADWKGTALAVTFMYTRCPLPDFCPLLDRQFAAVQDAVRGDAALRGRTRLLSVSFDPDHDTPAVLAAHARRVGADPAIWTFVTAARADVDAFAAQFGVVVQRAGAAGPEIAHNLRTVAIDGDGRVAAVFDGGDWKPSDLVEVLRSVRGRR